MRNVREANRLRMIVAEAATIHSHGRCDIKTVSENSDTRQGLEDGICRMSPWTW